MVIGIDEIIKIRPKCGVIRIRNFVANENKFVNSGLQTIAEAFGKTIIFH